MRIKDLRYVLAKAAERTPGIYYYSSDIVKDVPADAQDVVRNSCGLVAMDALRTIEKGGQAEISFGTVYQSDVDKGEWDAIVMRGEDSPIDEYPLPEYVVTAEPEDLRSWISENIDQTPKTIIMDGEMFKDFPEKTSIDGDQMSPMTQGVMSIAIAHEPHVKPGEKAQIIFTLVTVGAKEAAVFLIEIQRKS